MSKRKAFNFYYSYFDTAKLLSDKERLQFYDAMMERQFYGVDPKGLTGMVNFAWVSQKHSIDAQVKGWEDKMKESLQLSENHPSQPPSIGPIKPPLQQEKEKEEGQEKEEGKGPNADKSATLPKDDIEVRKQKFKESIYPFAEEFTPTTCKAFFEYWSEKNTNGKKMRFEMQKTFELSLRLKTWKEREKNYGATKKPITPSVSFAKDKDYGRL